HVAIRRLAQHLQRFLITRTVVSGDRLLDAVELDDDQALRNAGLVGFCGSAAGQETATAGGDRRSRDLGIGRQGLGIRDRTIARHPIRLRHPALPITSSLRRTAGDGITPWRSLAHGGHPVALTASRGAATLADRGGKDRGILPRAALDFTASEVA